MNAGSVWTFLALLLLGTAAGYYAARRPRPRTLIAERVRDDYLAGVSFLVNDQPDRALEAFLRAAELDADTVETHFLLGSLYRRRGEVDRAIRIHANIIARAALEPARREQAGFALAEDYLRAGLFDRAEKILGPLADAGAYRLAALRHLTRIYEQEHEWARAIEVCRALDRAGHAPQKETVAHYHCELAEAARRREAPDEARAHLRRARAECARFPRGALLRADIAIEQGDTRLAEELLAAVIREDAALANEIELRLARLARTAGAGGGAVVARVVAACPDAGHAIAFAAIMNDDLDDARFEQLAREFLAQDATVAGLIRAVGRDPAVLDADTVRDIAAVLRRLAAATPRYRCSSCGFASTGHFWQCPGCRNWDSQRPLLHLDLVAGLERKRPSA